MLSIATRRPPLGRRAATIGAAYAFFVTMLGTTLPTPLYPSYEARFGFSGLIVTVVFATYAVGVLAALLAQFAPDPLRLPYAVHLGLLVPAGLAIVLMPEPVDVRAGRVSFRIQRLSVPREMRAVFIRAATASFAAFAVLGLFTAVAPSFLAKLLNLTSPWLSGVVVFVLF